MEARVKAAIWVQAVLRQGNAAGRYGMVLRKGDPDAGGVLVVLHGRLGMMVLSQSRGVAGEMVWLRGTGAEPVDQAAVDAYVQRQLGYDADLWVLEFESPDLLPPFDDKVV